MSQRLSFVAALIIYLESEKLITREEAAKLMGGMWESRLMFQDFVNRELMDSQRVGLIFANFWKQSVFCFGYNKFELLLSERFVSFDMVLNDR